MYKQYIIMCLTFALGLLGVVGYAQGYTWTPMTLQDAEQMIRNFVGDPNMQFTLDTNRSLPSLPYNLSTWQPYDLYSGNQWFTVDLRTPDVFNVSDKSFWDETSFYGQPYDPNVLAPQEMTQANTQAIALAYVQSHYPDPSWLTNMDVKEVHGSRPNPTDADFIRSYKFSFYQIQNAVHCPADFDLEIDTIFGKVVNALGRHYPTLVSLTPGLTVDQAYASIFNALNLNGIPTGEPELFVTLPDGMGMERLAYQLEFFKDVNMITHYGVSVDANDGTILNVDFINGGYPSKKAVSPVIRSLQAKMAKKPKTVKTKLNCIMSGGKAKLCFPPLLIKNCPYLYIGYLNYGIPDSKLVYRSANQIEVIGKDRHLQFSTNSTTYQFNEKTRTLASKPVLIDDRCYVPLDVANDLFPFKIVYEEQNRCVRIDPVASNLRANKSVGFGSHLLAPTKARRTTIPTSDKKP